MREELTYKKIQKKKDFLFSPPRHVYYNYRILSNLGRVGSGLIIFDLVERETNTMKQILNTRYVKVPEKGKFSF